MDKITFLALFDRYIQYYRETKNYWEIRKPITLEIYQDKCNIVREYLLSTNRESLLPSEFDLKFTRNFLAWLLNKYSHNHAVRQIEKCKSVLDFGCREELINGNPISFFKIKRQPPKAPPYLSAEQIVLLEQYTHTSIQKTKAWAMMVVQLHTGYDYGDFGEINESIVQEFKGRIYLVKPRHKNGQECIAELPSIVKGIFQKYDYKMKLLPNTTYNKLIKIIFAELEFHLRPCSKDLRKLFFMNKLNNEGYSLQITSKMGGHKYIKTTEDYYVQKNINMIHTELEQRRA